MRKLWFVFLVCAGVGLAMQTAPAEPADGAAVCPLVICMCQDPPVDPMCDSGGQCGVQPGPPCQCWPLDDNWGFAVWCGWSGWCPMPIVCGVGTEDPACPCVVPAEPL